MTGHSLAGPTVRVLIVDDSAFMRTALTHMVDSEPDFQVVGTACNGIGALEKIAALDPDVVTLDINMPGLNGVGTLRQIMNRFPRPVIMVSAVTEKDAETTFIALGAGAFDYVPKQLSPSSLDIAHIRSDLIAKIRAAAHSRIARLHQNQRRKPPRSAAVESSETPPTPAIIAIGSSTGGPSALERILPQLPHDFPVPLLIVQHMPEGFTSTFAQRLNKLCAISVREASQREPIRPGTAYIAPAGIHLRVATRLSPSEAIISLNPQPHDALHIPSIDVLMKSVADLFGKRSLGVIMTGMGSDGAEGMTAIHRQGGFTIGQDEASCAVYGMPRACAELGILSRVVPLDGIPSQLIYATRQRLLA
jgi:two-component system chemotaxis response regulator CheB